MDFPWPGGKTLRKIWSSFEKTASGLYEPTKVRRLGLSQADVQRHQTLTLEQTALDVKAMREGRLEFRDGKLVSTSSAPALALPPPEQVMLPEVDTHNSVSNLLMSNAENIQRRLTTKMLAEELQRAVNLQKILVGAESEALNAGDENTSDDPIDDDWFNHWREHAQNVSEQTMQRLWARLLHGEAQKPGSISLPAMSALAQMTRSDAEVVAKVAPFVLDESVIWRGENEEIYKFVRFATFLHLGDLGLLTGLEAVGGLGLKKKSLSSDTFLIKFKAGKKVIVAEAQNPKMELEFPIIRLTAAGRILFKFADVAPDDSYLDEFIKSLNAQSLAVRIEESGGSL